MRIEEEVRLGSRVVVLSATSVLNQLDSPGSQCSALCVGRWGIEPWANDRVADWYEQTFEVTGLAQQVEQTLNLNLAEYTDEVRATAHIVCLLGNKYMWPFDNRERCIRLAVSRLREILEEQHFENPDIVNTIKAKIAMLDSSAAE